MRILLVAVFACSGGQHANDADCHKRGGAVFTGPATMPVSQQHSVCILPAEDAGKPCRDRADCHNICACPEGTKATGSESDVVGHCSTFPPASGGGWYCTVDGGRAHSQGIIVD